MRKVAGVLGLVSLVAAATLVVAAPAGAQSLYPPPACSLSLASGQTAFAGDPLSVFGAGFVPGQEVTLTANGAFAGSTHASDAGTIDTVVTIPANATSPVTLSAGACSITFNLGKHIVPIPPKPSPLVPAKPVQARALAFTGSDSSPLVVIGVVAVALGTVLIFGARRRGATKAAVEAAKVSS